MFGRKIIHKLEYFNRYSHILQILFKYGFGNIVDKLNLEHYFEHGRRILHIGKNIKEDKIKLTGPERLRLVCEELGPTFIKFGQILSTRPDLIPLNYVNELKKLQDKVEPVDFTRIKKVIEKSFGKNIEEVFEDINENSLGSASIGQVHEAVLKTGEKVVVKVKKPDIDSIVEIDVEILYNIARLIEKRIPEFAYYNPVKMVNEFSKSIKKEMDFSREGKNNDIIRLNFDKFKGFRVPKIYWDYTSDSVLTMEFIKGKNFSELLREGFKSMELAKIGANIYLKQILEDGFFHADPHPGNIFLEKDGTVVFIDYGIVGVLDEKDQENMAEMLEGIVQKDINKIVNAFKSFETFPEDLNEKALKSELKDLLEKYYNVPLKNINIGRLIDEMSQIVIRYRVTIPADFFLVGKTLMIIDGIARQLDPDFNMIEIARPFIEKLVLRKYSFNKIVKAILKNGENYKNLIENTPQDLQELIGKIKKDKISIDVRSSEIQNFNKIIDRVMNRVTAAIIIAALIVGSSTLIQSKTGIIIHGYSVLGIAGFIIAGFFAILVLIDIIIRG